MFCIETKVLNIAEISYFKEITLYAKDMVGEDLQQSKYFIGTYTYWDTPPSEVPVTTPEGMDAVIAQYKQFIYPAYEGERDNYGEMESSSTALQYLYSVRYSLTPEGKAEWAAAISAEIKAIIR